MGAGTAAMDADVEDLTLPAQQRRDSSPVLPSLPSLPSSRPALPRVLSRKRPFGASQSPVDEEQLAAAFNTSSDPAFFSSDETPDLENYSGSKRRKKKVYSGTWWGGRLRPSTSKQNVRGNNEKEDRQFRRNFDSGIFMADDTSASDLSSDGLFDELKAAQTVSYGHSEDSAESNVSDVLLVPRRVSSSRPKFKKWESDHLLSDELSAIDQLVAERVEICLEQGSPDVDLTGLSLTHLPASITQLNALVKQMPWTSGEYTDLSLHPRIYLANNNFTLFPGQLLNVPSIELLSLRQNQLAELPDKINKLTSLQKLNVSGNRLEYLPFSILAMLDNAQLYEIQSEPNPWRKVPPQEEQLADFPRVMHNRDWHTVCRVAVSPAMDITASGQEISSRTAEVQKSTHPRSPGLGETVLRSLAKLTYPNIDLSAAEEVADCPDNVKNLLRSLYKSQQTGGHECTFCGRSMILPRQQWIEWWSIEKARAEDRSDKPRHNTGRPFEIKTDIDAEEKEGDREEDQTLPFIRRTCGCRLQVEGLMEEKQLYEQLIKADESSVDESKAMKLGDWPRLWTR